MRLYKPALLQPNSLRSQLVYCKLTEVLSTIVQKCGLLKCKKTKSLVTPTNAGLFEQKYSKTVIFHLKSNHISTFQQPYSIT